MPTPVVVPRSLFDRKPPHGAPCTRCGLCCVAMLCPLGKAVFKRELGPCPALRWDNDLSSCGLMSEPELYAPERVLAVGKARITQAAKDVIGTEPAGCDMCVNGEPRDARFDARVKAWVIGNLTRYRAAQRAWGIKPTKELDHD